MWEKINLLFNVSDYQSDNIVSHASIPFCMHLKEDDFRIYFSCRNKDGKSLPYFIDAKISDGKIELLGSVSDPLMQLGELGTFDDSGIMPSSLIKVDNKIYMYYIGWNPQVTVSYRLSIGLAISSDEGKSFEPFSKSPICDRDLEEPFFNTAPFVIKEKELFKMWYISCTGWKVINGYPEPSYHVKYAESLDGIKWKKEGLISIDYDTKSKAIGRPCVILKGKMYEMFFSFRDTLNYRTEKGKGYQLGKATSVDGINWEKKYEETGIELSEDGWDSMMMEYCHVFNHKGIDYMLYNGNDFGRQGFGYAIRK
jgi:hypothetical protein